MTGCVGPLHVSARTQPRAFPCGETPVMHFPICLSDCGWRRMCGCTSGWVGRPHESVHRSQFLPRRKQNIDWRRLQFCVGHFSLSFFCLFPSRTYNNGVVKSFARYNPSLQGPKTFPSADRGRSKMVLGRAAGLGIHSAQSVAAQGRVFAHRQPVV